MIVKEAIDGLKARIKESYNDTLITNRLGWSLIRSAVGTLLHRDRSRLGRQLFKNLRYDTETVNLAEVSCVPLDCLACRIKLDGIMTTKNGPLIGYIGSDDGYTSYNLVTPMEYRRNQRIQPKFENYAFIDGEYLYLDKCIPCVIINGYTDPSNQGCSALRNELPLPQHLEGAMYRLAMEELQIFFNKPQDVTENQNPQA